MQTRLENAVSSRREMRKIFTMAAFKVLEEKKEPMSTADILAEALKKGYLKKAQCEDSPEATMTSALHADLKKKSNSSSNGNNEGSDFWKTREGVFGLRVWEQQKKMKQQAERREEKGASKRGGGGMQQQQGGKVRGKLKEFRSMKIERKRKNDSVGSLSPRRAHSAEINEQHSSDGEMYDSKQARLDLLLQAIEKVENDNNTAQGGKLEYGRRQRPAGVSHHYITSHPEYATTTITNNGAFGYHHQNQLSQFLGNNNTNSGLPKTSEQQYYDDYNMFQQMAANWEYYRMWTHYRQMGGGPAAPLPLSGEIMGTHTSFSWDPKTAKTATTDATNNPHNAAIAYVNLNPAAFPAGSQSPGCHNNNRT